jgi:hypothetical protein
MPLFIIKVVIFTGLLFFVYYLLIFVNATLVKNKLNKASQVQHTASRT